MPVLNLFSKRQKKKRGEIPDVYQYETIPSELRVQVVQILEDSFGYNLSEFCGLLHKSLSREYGVFRLGGRRDPDEVSVFNFLLETEETDKILDVIELSFGSIIDNIIRDKPHRYEGRKLSADEAIFELNFRFREHGVGYQYESGRIIRIDSQLIHAEVVRPALQMLSASMYEGANEEFLSAHDHYRNGRNKECLNDALKAFESCLKAICDERGWAYTEKDTASRLLSIVFDEKLIPDFMKSHFSALRSVLESGVPTIRNRLSGHGQGPDAITVPDYIAAYALHITASNILLLSRAEEGK